MIIAEWTTNLPRSEWGKKFSGITTVSENKPHAEAWSEHEVSLLFSGLTAREISEQTGRSQQSIYIKRARLKRNK